MADITEIILNGTAYELARGGISSVAQSLLINILRNATYTSDQSTNITNLETELANGGGSSRVAIINTLTNCTSNNSASSITVGSSYIATITADEGYDLDTASVTMDGVDVTSTVYSAGVITITSVTGTIVITVTAISNAEAGLAHYWNLKSGSIIDTIDGETSLTLGENTVVTSGTGATIDAVNDYISVPFTYGTYVRMKIKFGAMTNNTSDTGRLIQAKYGASSTPAVVLRYDNTNSIWETYSNTYVTEVTASDAFANGEIIVQRTSTDLARSVDIVFNGDTIVSYGLGGQYNFVDIGGTQGGGFYTIVVESIKVYTE